MDRKTPNEVAERYENEISKIVAEKDSEINNLVMKLTNCSRLWCIFRDEFNPDGPGALERDSMLSEYEIRDDLSESLVAGQSDGRCPFCNSENIERRPDDQDGPYYLCHDCHENIDSDKIIKKVIDDE
jgi:hypothetical protein